MIGGLRGPQGSRGPGGLGNLGNLRQILMENNKIICIIGIGRIIGADMPYNCISITEKTKEPKIMAFILSILQIGALL